MSAGSLFPRPEPRSFTVTVLGAPRTKKTHQRIVKIGKFSKILPSTEYRDWEEACIRQMQPSIALLTHRRLLPITYPVHLCALVYRHARVGDMSNFQQAVADMLQEAGVLQNDSLIVHWDGTRLRRSRKNPRVEITIAEFQEDRNADDED